MKIVRLGGVFAVVAGLLFFLFDQKDLWILIFVVVGLGMILFTSDVLVTADRATRTLRVVNGTLFFRTTKEIPFDDIEQIRAERDAGGSKIGPTYRIVALLRNGKTVPFRSSFSSDASHGQRDQAEQLNAYIGCGVTRTAKASRDRPEETAEASGKG